jgi:hypothetical protein
MEPEKREIQKKMEINTDRQCMNEFILEWTP